MQTELPEYPFRGPFGGIQSELPLDEIELFGFSECLNVLLRNALARPRPGNEFASALASAPVGIGDFYDVNGTRHTVAWLRDSLWEYTSPSTKVQITGTLTGADTDLMDWTVVNNGLLFSQGVDKVQVWNGITPGFAASAVAAVPAKFLMELATHLLAIRTIEGGTERTQRVRWTGAGDYTDWASFSSGVIDVLNSLGPINGRTKINENGFLLHTDGITRVIPTGIGSRPFDFVPFNERTRGCFFPRSVASFGDSGSAYVSRNDIVFFDGSSFVSLGARPIEDGRKKVGARSRIVSDLLLANPTQVYGFASQAIGGVYFQAYWLIIPNVSMWVYNLDEGNWTRFVFTKTPKVMGRFESGIEIRIMDLIGAIQDQNWSPATLLSESFFDTPAIGFTDGSVGLPNFSVPIETGFLLASGMLTMGDRRHNKRISRIRLTFIDAVETPFELILSNERGEQFTQTVNLPGTSTGFLRQFVVPVDISGMFLRWQIVGQAGTSIELSEVAPIYSPGGEYKNT
jgi:hypothetical protein